MPQITRREFIRLSGRAAAAAPLFTAACGEQGSPQPAGEAHPSSGKPNFVILFADDMGYGDWSRGGNPTIRTPNLNRMADQGMQFTQFYSANAVCSPSRSSLLTGRNPIRTGVLQVFFPGNGRGMSTAEITLADALKPRGYRSACIGKWHLGSTYEYRPLRQGFDYYFGLLYSNDMYRPDLWRNDERIESPSEQTTLTRRYTEEAIRFIEQEQDNPFLVYLPYTMPHVPVSASGKFKDSSRRGLFGDVIEEIDWSVGRINAVLDSLGLSENTFVLFTSDNGPWMTERLHGGTAGQLRGFKGDTWEGGIREPAVARMPGTVPAGEICMDVAGTVDLFPTIMAMAGVQMPTDRPFDGADISRMLRSGRGGERTLYFYRGEHLNAVRHGRWKLHFRYFDHSGPPGYMNSQNWKWADPPMLYDLEQDPSERFDVAAGHPEVVREITALADSYKAEIERLGENRELVDWFVNDWRHAPRKGE